MANSEIGTLVDLIQTVHGRVSGHIVSLPEYTKGTNVVSRLYIEEDLANEEIILPIISTLNQLYTGYILTALQLNQYVANSKTVRDILKLVATEEYIEVVDVAKESFGELNLDESIVSTEASVIDLDPSSQRLMSGRVIELDLNVQTENNESARLKITLYVQLIPYLLKPEVVAGFIGLNFSPSLLRRYTQFKTGNIGALDFMFARDLVTDYRKAMKADKSGILHDMLDKQNNSLTKSLLGLVGLSPQNHNLAHYQKMFHYLK